MNLKEYYMWKIKSDEHIENPCERKWTVSHKENEIAREFGCYIYLWKSGLRGMYNDNRLVNRDGDIVRRGHILWIEEEARRAGIRILKYIPY